MLAKGNYHLDGTIFCDTQGGRLRKGNVLRRSPLRQILGRRYFWLSRALDRLRRQSVRASGA
jgi:hypothetical protein